MQDQKIIENKLGFLKLAQTLGSVSEACKVMGLSRDSLYGSRNYTIKETRRRSRAANRI